MKRFFESLISRIKPEKVDDFLLDTLLEQNPGLKTTFEEQPVSISLQSIRKWHEFGQGSALDASVFPTGQVKGWLRRGKIYTSSIIDIPDIRAIGQCHSETGRFDISQVAGLTGSKSDLSRYRTLDAFATDRCADKIAAPSPDTLLANLSHNEIRILEEGSADFFMRFAWDERLWLCNAGGSHHFAAARHIAKRIGCKVPLSGRVITQSINPVAVEGLRRRFRGFLVSTEPRALDIFKQALRKTKVSYYLLPQDPQQPGGQVFLFPLSEPESIRAARLLDRHGFVDVLLELRSIVIKQDQLKKLKKNCSATSMPRLSNSRCRADNKVSPQAIFTPSPSLAE